MATAFTSTDFLSKILPSIISGVGSGLSSSSSGKRSAAELAQQKQISDNQLAQQGSQFNAQMLFDLMKQSQDTGQHQADTVLQNHPIGEAQSFAQKQSLAQAILGGVSNSRYGPGDPAVASAMGSRGGPLTNFSGFDPAKLEQLFGSNATTASLLNRDKDVSNVNPSAPTTNYGSLGLGGPAQGQADSYAAGRQTLQQTSQADATQQLQNAIHGSTSVNTNTSDPNAASTARLLADPQVQQTMNAGVGAETKKKVINARAQALGIQIPQGMEFNEHGQLVKHSSLLGKIGHTALSIAPLAANFIPGIGPLASIALGAGLGGVNSAVNHQNPLLGAIIGGASGAIPTPRLIPKLPTPGIRV